MQVEATSAFLDWPRAMSENDAAADSVISVAATVGDHDNSPGNLSADSDRQSSMRPMTSEMKDYSHASRNLGRSMILYWTGGHPLVKTSKEDSGILIPPVPSAPLPLWTDLCHDTTRPFPALVSEDFCCNSGVDASHRRFAPRTVE